MLINNRPLNASSSPGAQSDTLSMHHHIDTMIKMQGNMGCIPNQVPNLVKCITVNTCFTCMLTTYVYIFMKHNFIVYPVHKVIEQIKIIYSRSISSILKGRHILLMIIQIIFKDSKS